MRIKVDYVLCQGHAVCMSEAPEVFQVDEKTGENPGGQLREKVELAVKYCPTSALSLVEEESGKEE